MNVRWSAPRSRFVLRFGGEKELTAMCPHILVKDQLEQHLNTHRNLGLLAKIIHETYSPLRYVRTLIGFFSSSEPAFLKH